jgi:uncharacterized glyoxalase superfamily protein PhnB
MKPNRSIPAATVIPVLVYPDVREAVAWLCAAFGFVERVRIGQNHRAQLRFGDGAVIVGDVRGDRRPPRGDEVTHSVMVRLDDVRAHCERARENGARILMEPTDFEYGERQYSAADPAATSGHSLTRWPTLPPRNGAGNPSVRNDRLVGAERWLAVVVAEPERSALGSTDPEQSGPSEPSWPSVTGHRAGVRAPT